MKEMFLTDSERERYLRFFDVFLRCRTDCAVGVPDEMRDGPVDDDGWAPWKPVDSTITPAEVLNLESEVGGRFPGLFRAYLTHKAMLMTQFKVVLPVTPVDKPLVDLRRNLDLINQTPYYNQNRLVPFGYDSNDAGPVCFDMSQSRKNGECPIVCVEVDFVGDVVYRRRPIAGSFEELLDEIETEMLSYEIIE